MNISIYNCINLAFSAGSSKRISAISNGLNILSPTNKIKRNKQGK